MSDTNTTYRNPKRIRLTIGCVYLSTYYTHDDRGVIAKAREVLDRHNIELDVFPANGAKSPFNTINHDQLPKDTMEDYTVIYNMAKAKLKQMGCTFAIPLPVVFGQYKSYGYGIAPKVHKQHLTRLVMIAPTGNADKMDLLHEIGHAAELQHDNRDGPPRNFMHEASPRSVMYQYQVQAVAKALFSVG